MKKLTKKAKTLSLLILLAAVLLVPTVQAVKPNGPSADKGLHNEKRKVKHLYLYEKDPETWQPVEDGAWGKLTILTHKDKYIFNGHGLDLDSDYSLINYAPGTDWTVPDINPWPAADSLGIGDGATNEEGNIHIKGSLSQTLVGKMWLVLSNDFSEGTGMTGWTPTSYLFEYDLIN